MTETIECNRCGRELKTEKSIEQGYGPICMQKHKDELAEIEFQKNQTKLEDYGVEVAQ